MGEDGPHLWITYLKTPPLKLYKLQLHKIYICFGQQQAKEASEKLYYYYSYKPDIMCGWVFF